MLMNHQEQLDALASLVDDWAIKKAKRVKGEFTSVDFVTFKLNQIFTPGGWSFTILDGPNLVTIKETAAYTLLTGRLSVCFADGSKAHQDDVGIWPLVATGAREGKPLTDTAPERYETVLKAARTDCLKNAARNLGTCFAPLTDLALREAKRRANYEHSNEEGEGARSAQKDIDELYGHQDPPLKPAPQSPPEPELLEETGQSSGLPTETAEGGASDDGLERLLEDVNEVLIEKALDTYKDTKHIRHSLKLLGYTKYKPSLHEEMIEHLVERHDEPETPMNVKARLQAAADLSGWFGKPTDAQRGLLIGVLNEVLGNDEQVKFLLAWLFDYTTEGFSRSMLKGPEVVAVLDELAPEKVDGKKYEPTNSRAVESFKLMLRQAHIDTGQTEMPL